jgi:hypothetical protein
VNHYCRFVAPLLVITLLAIAPARSETSRAFGTLRGYSAERARAEAWAWLQARTKADQEAQKRFETIWADGERTVLECLGATFELGDPEAAALLKEARDAHHSAPTNVPKMLTDSSRSAFERANLGLLYARMLVQRRVYEEALGVLRLTKVEQVADPAAYFFDRAVAEHALMQKSEANRSIVGLIEDVGDVPDRYRVLALLMYQDMLNWRDKDLGDIARKMDNIERRLELARGGPQTQKLQREVVARLDELIKQLEQGGC